MATWRLLAPLRLQIELRFLPVILLLPHFVVRNCSIPGYDRHVKRGEMFVQSHHFILIVIKILFKRHPKYLLPFERLVVLKLKRLIQKTQLRIVLMAEQNLTVVLDDELANLFVIHGGLIRLLGFLGYFVVCGWGLQFETLVLRWVELVETVHDGVLDTWFVVLLTLEHRHGILNRLLKGRIFGEVLVGLIQFEDVIEWEDEVWILVALDTHLGEMQLGPRSDDKVLGLGIYLHLARTFSVIAGTHSGSSYYLCPWEPGLWRLFCLYFPISNSLREIEKISTSWDFNYQRFGWTCGPDAHIVISWRVGLIELNHLARRTVFLHHRGQGVLFNLTYRDSAL